MKNHDERRVRGKSVGKIKHVLAFEFLMPERKMLRLGSIDVAEKENCRNYGDSQR